MSEPKHPPVVFWTNQEEQKGPFTRSEMEDKIKSGALPEGSMFWAEGMKEWQYVSVFGLYAGQPKNEAEAEPAKPLPLEVKHGPMLGGLALIIFSLGLLATASIDHEAGIVLRPLLILVAVCAYLVPGAYAHHIRHPQWEAILGLNIAGGWTVIGWITAMTWALVVEPSEGRASGPPQKKD